MAITVVNTANAGNSSAGATSVTIPSATAGNTLFLVRGLRGIVASNTTPAIPSGFKRLGYYNTSPTQTAQSVVFESKIAAGGETSITVSASVVNYIELAGFSSTATLELLQALHATSVNSGAPSIQSTTTAAVAGRDSIILAILNQQPASPNPGPVTLTGFISGSDSGYAALGNRCRLGTWYVSSPTGTYTGTFSSSGDGAEDSSVSTIELAEMYAEQIYQLPVEVVINPTSGQAQLYQEAVEAIVSPISGKAQLYQDPVEVVVGRDLQAHGYIIG